MAAEAEPLRIGLFHTELERKGPGLLLRDILVGEDRQIEAVVAVLRASDADVLVLGGVDYDLEGHALGALADLVEGYPYRASVAPNRGLDPGADRNGDGYFGDPEDAQGWADFRGQEGLAVISRWPLGEVRDFTSMLWTELPGHAAPDGVSADQRLSTTAHFVVPVELRGGRTVHVGAWHATPPVFDGPEDFNGRRNHDEAAFWLRWMEGAWGAAPDAVVLAGMANLDAVDGDGRTDALNALLMHPKLVDPMPESVGAVAASLEQGGINARHNGDPALDTVDWDDDGDRPGNLRVDYILPGDAFVVVASGVLWPEEGDLLRGDVLDASRHRLVWVDLCSKGDAECLDGVRRPEPGKQLR